MFKREKKFKLRYAHPTIEETGKLIYVKKVELPFYQFTSEWDEAALFEVEALRFLKLPYLIPVGVMIYEA